MVEELLFLIITTQESISFVKFSKKSNRKSGSVAVYNAERRKKQRRGHERQPDNPFDPIHSHIQYQLWRMLQIIDVMVDQSLMLRDFKLFHVLWITTECRTDRRLPETQMGERDKEAPRGGKTFQARAKRHYLVSSWSESSCFRCLERSFFSIERRTQARAFPTSVLISLMFWMCLHMETHLGLGEVHFAFNTIKLSLPAAYDTY